MFTVNFNDLATVNVSHVEERYSARTAGKDTSLTLRIPESAQTLEYYLTIFETEGALSKITVTDANNNENVYTQYTCIDSVSRTLVTGGASVQIVLTRAEATE